MRSRLIISKLHVVDGQNAGPQLRLEVLHAMITWSYDAAVQGTGLH